MYGNILIETIRALGPISAPEIVLHLKTTYPTLNKTTIYRQLEKLAKAGSIQELFLGNDYKSYEITANHHHIVCTECKKIQCLPEDCNISHPKTDFKITSHSLEFYGLCPTCK